MIRSSFGHGFEVKGTNNTFFSVYCLIRSADPHLSEYGRRRMAVFFFSNKLFNFLFVAENPLHWDISTNRPAPLKKCDLL